MSLKSCQPALVSSANEKMSSKKVRGSAGEKTLSPEEQEAKVYLIIILMNYCHFLFTLKIEP